jgi:hypothetical protein
MQAFPKSHSFSICTAQVLCSAVHDNGSNTAIVSQLAQVSRKWNAIQSILGGTSGATLALTITFPRRDFTRIFSSV